MNTDVQGNEARYQETEFFLQRYIQTLFVKDLDAWMDLLDDNCVLEFPFAPQGRLKRVDGKAALSSYMQGIINNDAEFLRIAQQKIHLTQDPAVIIVEIAFDGRIISTGNPFNTMYVWVMSIKEGKLIHQRDYWNPLAMLEMRGGSNVSTPNDNASGQE